MLIKNYSVFKLKKKKIFLNLQKIGILIKEIIKMIQIVIEWN
jgi:hypothetical protein